MSKEHVTDEEYLQAVSEINNRTPGLLTSEQIQNTLGTGSTTTTGGGTPSAYGGVGTTGGANPEPTTVEVGSGLQDFTGSTDAGITETNLPDLTDLQSFDTMYHDWVNDGKTFYDHSNLFDAEQDGLNGSEGTNVLAENKAKENQPLSAGGVTTQGGTEKKDSGSMSGALAGENKIETVDTTQKFYDDNSALVATQVDRTGKLLGYINTHADEIDATYGKGASDSIRTDLGTMNRELQSFLWGKDWYGIATEVDGLKGYQDSAERQTYIDRTNDIIDQIDTQLTQVSPESELYSYYTGLKDFYVERRDSLQDWSDSYSQYDADDLPTMEYSQEYQDKKAELDAVNKELEAAKDAGDDGAYISTLDQYENSTIVQLEKQRNALMLELSELETRDKNDFDTKYADAQSAESKKAFERKYWSELQDENTDWGAIADNLDKQLQDALSASGGVANETTKALETEKNQALDQQATVAQGKYFSWYSDWSVANIDSEIGKIYYQAYGVKDIESARIAADNAEDEYEQILKEINELEGELSGSTYDNDPDGRAAVSSRLADLYAEAKEVRAEADKYGAIYETLNSGEAQFSQEDQWRLNVLNTLKTGREQEAFRAKYDYDTKETENPGHGSEMAYEEAKSALTDAETAFYMGLVEYAASQGVDLTVDEAKQKYPINDSLGTAERGLFGVGWRTGAVDYMNTEKGEALYNAYKAAQSDVKTAESLLLSDAFDANGDPKDKETWDEATDRGYDKLAYLQETVSAAEKDLNIATTISGLLGNNAVNTARQYTENSEIYARTGVDPRYLPTDQWTDEETAKMAYLLGQGFTEAAYNYGFNLNEKYNNAHANEITEKAQEWALDKTNKAKYGSTETRWVNKILIAGMPILTSLPSAVGLNALDYVADLGDLAATGKMQTRDFVSIGQLASIANQEMVSALDSTFTGENIFNKAFGEGSVAGTLAPNLLGRYGDLTWGDAYSAWSSSVQSLETMLVGQIYGGAIAEGLALEGAPAATLLEKLGDKIATTLNLAPGAAKTYAAALAKWYVDSAFFFSSAAEGVRTAKANGASDDRAMLVGTLNGVAEAAGEELSLEFLLSWTPAAFFGKAVQFFGSREVEGSEEFFTEALNFCANWYANWDTRETDVQQWYDEAIAAGLSKEAAARRTCKKMVSQMCDAYVQGTLSTGLSSISRIVEVNKAAKKTGAVYEAVGEANYTGFDSALDYVASAASNDVVDPSLTTLNGQALVADANKYINQRAETRSGRDTQSLKISEELSALNALENLTPQQTAKKEYLANEEQKLNKETAKGATNLREVGKFMMDFQELSPSLYNAWVASNYEQLSKVNGLMAGNSVMAYLKDKQDYMEQHITLSNGQSAVVETELAKTLRDEYGAGMETGSSAARDLTAYMSGYFSGDPGMITTIKKDVTKTVDYLGKDTNTRAAVIKYINARIKSGNLAISGYDISHPISEELSDKELARVLEDVWHFYRTVHVSQEQLAKAERERLRNIRRNGSGTLTERIRSEADRRAYHDSLAMAAKNGKLYIGEYSGDDILAVIDGLVERTSDYDNASARIVPVCKALGIHFYAAEGTAFKEGELVVVEGNAVTFNRTAFNSREVTGEKKAEALIGAMLTSCTETVRTREQAETVKNSLEAIDDSLPPVGYDTDVSNLSDMEPEEQAAYKEKHRVTDSTLHDKVTALGSKADSVILWAEMQEASEQEKEKEQTEERQKPANVIRPNPNVPEEERIGYKGAKEKPVKERPPVEQPVRRSVEEFLASVTPALKAEQDSGAVVKVSRKNSFRAIGYYQYRLDERRKAGLADITMDEAAAEFKALRKGEASMKDIHTADEKVEKVNVTETTEPTVNEEEQVKAETPVAETQAAATPVATEQKPMVIPPANTAQSASSEDMLNVSLYMDEEKADWVTRSEYIRRKMADGKTTAAEAEQAFNDEFAAKPETAKRHGVKPTAQTEAEVRTEMETTEPMVAEEDMIEEDGKWITQSEYIAREVARGKTTAEADEAFEEDFNVGLNQDKSLRKGESLAEFKPTGKGETYESGNYTDDEWTGDNGTTRESIGTGGVDTSHKGRSGQSNNSFSEGIKGVFNKGQITPEGEVKFDSTRQSEESIDAAWHSRKITAREAAYAKKAMREGCQGVIFVSGGIRSTAGYYVTGALITTKQKYSGHAIGKYIVINTRATEWERHAEHELWHYRFSVMLDANPAFRNTVQRVLLENIFRHEQENYYLMLAYYAEWGGYADAYGRKANGNIAWTEELIQAINEEFICDMLSDVSRGYLTQIFPSYYIFRLSAEAKNFMEYVGLNADDFNGTMTKRALVRRYEEVTEKLGVQENKLKELSAADKRDRARGKISSIGKEVGRLNFEHHQLAKDIAQMFGQSHTYTEELAQQGVDEFNRKHLSEKDATVLPFGFTAVDAESEVAKWKPKIDEQKSEVTKRIEERNKRLRNGPDGVGPKLSISDEDRSALDEITNPEERNAVASMGSDTEVQLDDHGGLVLASNDESVMYSMVEYYEPFDASGKSGRQLLKENLEARVNKKGKRAFSDADINFVLDKIDAEAKYLENLAIEVEREYDYTKLKEHLNMQVLTNAVTGRQILSALVNNGEYPVNFDLTLTCKKREAYMHAMERLIADGVFDKVRYDEAAIAMIAKTLRKYGYETACIGCFVEARRLKLQTWAEAICEEWNDEVDKRADNAGNFGFYERTEHFSDDEMNALLSDLEAAGEKNKQGNLNLGKGSAKEKMGALLDRVPELRKHLQPADLLTPKGLGMLREYDTNLFSMVRSRYGANSPKFVQDFSSYGSEMAKLSFKFIEQMTGNSVKGAASFKKLATEKIVGEAPVKEDGETNADFSKRKKKYEATLAENAERIENEAMCEYLFSIGGGRIQSFSDFMIENTFDMLQIVADAYAKGFPMHGYTKEQICLRLFGMTGIKWNGSFIAHVDPKLGKSRAGLMNYVDDGTMIKVEYDGQVYGIGLDDVARNIATGNKSYIQSIGMKDMIALQLDPRYSKHIGSITIGVSNAQIWAMLDSRYFRQIIPYHSSGMNKTYMKLMGIDNYNDYQAFQNTTLGQLYALDKDENGEVKVDKNGKPKLIKVKELEGMKKPDMSFSYNAEVQRLVKAKVKDAPRRAATNYVKWCRSMHEVYSDGGELIGYAEFKPKFSECKQSDGDVADFTESRNYYKLLADFNMYDCLTEEQAIQGAVELKLPSKTEENGILSEQQLEAYKQELRKTGLFTEREIESYATKTQMDFNELVDKEVRGRAEYEAKQAPLFEDMMSEIEDNLLNDKTRKGESKYLEDRDWRDKIRAAKRAAKEAKGIVDEDETKLSLADSTDPIDVEYREAIENNDPATADKLVQEQAAKNGYTVKKFHQTYDETFNIFDLSRGTHSVSERMMPYGIFTKGTDRDIGLAGKRQMALYVKAPRVLSVKDRTELESAVDDTYAWAVDNARKLEAMFLDNIGPERNAFIEAIRNYCREHPNALHGDALVKESIPMPTEELKRLQYAYFRKYDELADNIDDARQMTRQWITDWMGKNNYDALDVEYDAGHDGRHTDAFIVLNNRNVKSADTITYDDNGEIIPLSRRFNDDSEDIRYSFTGEIGASETDRRNLETAVDMLLDGKDSETIRLATGWFEGYDGQWKMEIDDSRATFLLPTIIESIQGKADKKVEKLKSDYSEGKIGKRAYENNIYFAKYAADPNFIRQRILNEPYTLGELLKHPKLYEKYPKLKSVRVIFVRPSGYRGSTEGAYSTIQLNENLYYDPEEAKLVLLHEIQHQIQCVEGFATGSSVEYWAMQDNNPTVETAFDLYQRTAGEVEARDSASRANLSSKQRKATRPDIDRTDAVFVDRVEEAIASVQDYADKHAQYSIANPELFASATDMMGKVNSLIYFAGGDTYGFAMRNRINPVLSVELEGNLANVAWLNNPKAQMLDVERPKDADGNFVSDEEAMADPEFRRKIEAAWERISAEDNSIFVGDVVDATQGIEKLAGYIYHFHASPVCCNYSRASRKQGDSKIDRKTAQATAEALRKIKPRVFTLEQVAEYMKSKALTEDILPVLEDMGYGVYYQKYNAADYGAPTSRERMFLVAVKGATNEEVKALAPIHEGNRLSKSEYKTWDEILLPLLENPNYGEEVDKLPNYMQERAERIGLDYLTPGADPILIMGGNQGYGLNVRKTGRPAATITTKGEAIFAILPGESPRIFRVTPEGVKLLQGLDGYKLPWTQGVRGDKTFSYTVIGNGIPPQLTRAVVEPVLNYVLEEDRAAATGKDAVYSMEDLNAKQEKALEFNERQTEVGSPLKTLNGSTISRYKNNVGKAMPGAWYVHKDYAAEIVPNDLLTRAESILAETYPDFAYNCIKYVPDKNTVTFQSAPDFDTAREPRVGEYVTVNYATGEARLSDRGSNYIWHHKWNWVKNDYQGFSVAASWEWSKEWLSTLREPADGNGIDRWNAQLDRYDLPHDSGSVSRFSLEEVEPIVPSSNAWTPGAITLAEFSARFPKAYNNRVDEGGLTEAEKEELKKGDATQRANTIETYRKFYEWVSSKYADRDPKEVRILDASSGLGLGTELGRSEFGFSVDDIEPFPNINYKPKYYDYSTLHEKYDVILSSAVLNVLQQDQRDAMVKKFDELLKPGGVILISVRSSGKGDVGALRDNAVSDEELINQPYKNVEIANGEFYVGRGGVYQKGFTQNELRAYIQDALGDGYEVLDKGTGKGKSGLSVTPIAVVAEKKVGSNESDTLYSLADADTPFTKLSEMTEEQIDNAAFLFQGKTLLNQIWSGEKTIETRGSLHTLDNWIGKRVGIAMPNKDRTAYDLLGYVTFGERKTYNTEEEYKADQSKHRIGSTGDYAWKSKTRYGYELLDAEKLDTPVSVPANAECYGLSNARYATAIDISQADIPTDVRYSQSGNPFKPGSLNYQMYEAISKGNLQGTIDAMNTVAAQSNNPFATPMIKVTPQRIDAAKKWAQQTAAVTGQAKLGENPNPKPIIHPKANLPDAGGKQNRTRGFFSNVVNAPNISDEGRNIALVERMRNGKLTYVPVSNKDSLTYANNAWEEMVDKYGDKALKVGYDTVKRQYEANRIPSADQLALTEKILIEAFNAQDYQTAMDVLVMTATIGTELGQAVQAFRMLREATPVGQLYYMQRVVDRLNRRYADRIAAGKMNKLVLDPALVAAAYKAIASKDEKQINDAFDAIRKNIATQLPVNWIERWNAWRYLAMLGNFRTHIRNMLGNGGFMPAMYVSDLMAASVQSFMPEEYRTRSLKQALTPAILSKYHALAKQQAEFLEDDLRGQGKVSMESGIMNERQIFKTKPLEWLRKTNGDVLEMEDWLALKWRFEKVLAEYLGAKDYENLSAKDQERVLYEGQMFAIKEAHKATYRDISKVANALNQLRRQDKRIGVMIDAALPFVRTPINILKRGLEYSPAGLAKGIWDMAKSVRALKANKSEETIQGVTDALDLLCEGLTGTGVLLIGYLLASMGLLRATGGGDDDQNEFDELQGYQDYALILGNKTYTIDWLAPIALPLFVGASIFESADKRFDEKPWLEWAEGMTTILEPMISLSMLDGVNNLFSSMSYADENERVWTFLTQLATSYASQGIPTIFAQTERILQDNQTRTYVDTNSSIPDWLQRFLQTSTAKIPGLTDKINEAGVAGVAKTDYVDKWGRKKTGIENAFWRAAYQLFSPGYLTDIETTSVDTELQRVSDALGGDRTVFPDSASKTYTFNTETRTLTGEEYAKMQEVKGQTAFEQLSNLFALEWYQGLDIESQKAAIEQVYSYANEKAKEAVIDGYVPDGWTELAEAIGVGEYAIFNNREGKDNESMDEKIEYIITNPNLSYEQQGTLIADGISAPDYVYSPDNDAIKLELLNDGEHADDDRFEEICRDLYIDQYTELMNNAEYKAADDDLKLEWIKALRTEVKTQAGEALAAEIAEEAETDTARQEILSIGKLRETEGIREVLNSGKTRDEQLDALKSTALSKADSRVRDDSNPGYDLVLSDTQQAQLDAKIWNRFSADYKNLVISNEFKALTEDEQIAKVKDLMSDTADEIEAEFVADLSSKGELTTELTPVTVITNDNLWRLCANSDWETADQADYIVECYSPSGKLKVNKTYIYLDNEDKLVRTNAYAEYISGKVNSTAYKNASTEKKTELLADYHEDALDYSKDAVVEHMKSKYF